MGIFKMSKCNCENNYTQLTSNNPNPKNFTIDKIKVVGSFLIAKINYPNCKNYEGNKILLYNNISEKELRASRALDPHFCKRQHLSPLARFEPTERGWKMAVELAEILNK